MFEKKYINKYEIQQKYKLFNYKAIRNTYSK